MVLGKYNEAVSAFERLYELAGAQPGILLGYANALTMANNGRVTGKPEHLAQKVLEMEPGNGNGLWIVGMAAFEQGKFQHAINYWQQLLGQIENDTKAYNEVETLISRAEQQLSETGNQSETLISNQTSDDQVSKSISKSITVNVSLSEHLVQDTNPTDTLFIQQGDLIGKNITVDMMQTGSVKILIDQKVSLIP
jgi:cytochrome c-type biogenesis protein CcmH